MQLRFTVVMSLCCACGAASPGVDGGPLDAGLLARPLTCGESAARPDLTGGSIEISGLSVSIVTPGSDLTGASVTRSSAVIRVRHDVDAPADESLTALVNGCPVARYTQDDTTYMWATKAADAAFSVTAGRPIVFEVVQAGVGVIARRSFPAPAVLPTILAPMPHAAITRPIDLRWTPIDLSALDASTTKLSATGWTIHNGSGGTKGSLQIADPLSGQASWNAGTAQWTSIQLSAQVSYGGGFDFYFSGYLPVNP